MRNAIITMAAAALVCAGGLPAADDDDNAPRAVANKQLELNENIVQKIPVHHNKGVTTIQFPSAGLNINGANVTKSPGSPGDFLIAHEPSDYYFSVRALKKNARGNLNVVYKRKTYVLELVEQGDSPWSTVTFTGGGRGSAARSKGSTPPAVLISLLDKAKAFDKFEKHFPEALHGAKRVVFREPVTFEYRKFDALLHEVIRFNANDTLVFKVTLRNKSDKRLAYKPEMLAVRRGEHLYFSSLADASGVMPPRSDSTIHFCVTGRPDGGRNDIDADNNFVVVVSLEGDDLPKDRRWDVSEREQAINMLARLQDEASKAETKAQLDEVGDRIKTLRSYLDSLSPGKIEINEKEAAAGGEGSLDERSSKK